MSNFKDFLKQDLGTFFNEDEFAQSLVINGKETIVVLDPEQLQKKQYGSGGEGLENAELLFSVKKTELNRPRTGEVMTIGKRKFRVLNVSSEDEIYVITLERNQ
jgi:hypothetical protein